ncbi:MULTISPECIES: GNAT family N-acetyltransferase [Dehalobacter]|jgi:acetoin utilization protein AcuA|uniref:GNAT family N-acetyltransferase n=2 Tax=Dehalobacter restrictus TaxID=55583 RepID=A0A857DG95_9FIRM|nr:MULTISPECIES: GNAT family N-acetyltransferase [Dehalobacter]AHF09727.1 acetoin dehydrogenase [Dehalobacter restrictus DSM 9455]MCG1025364.1 GNAT family N-acetyltransferase [Dehalobacter sp.]MDJ0306347.1 GNAT family N-acetyltransferase [Dehalobacter sp.]OCZ52725.1 acetoin dehydrogenase [Dehalobacter sp. TeCB1]QHA00320.1 GNAT family N-acetyltransferase [Dehalobacter restrictus]
MNKEEWINITCTIQTSKGELLISGVTSPDILEKLEIDQQLKAFRPAAKQKKAIVEISCLPQGKVVSAQINGELVGYITFHPPDEFERWSSGQDKVLELGAIEVSPRYRNYGVARRMLEAAFGDEKMEDYIVIATEYYWHWDLDGTNLPIWEYREMMRRLMTHTDLLIKDTDDEEITSHPANMLMVRYGKNITKKMIHNFDRLLFLNGK